MKTRSYLVLLLAAMFVAASVTLHYSIAQAQTASSQPTRQAVDDQMAALRQKQAQEQQAAQAAQMKIFLDFSMLQRECPGELDVYLEGAATPVATAVKLDSMRNLNGQIFYKFIGAAGDYWLINQSKIVAIHGTQAPKIPTPPPHG